MANLLLAASLLPPAAILLWVLRSDRLREPPRVVALTALFGALVVIPCAAVEIGLSRLFDLKMGDGSDSVTEAVVIGFVVAATVEECFKFAVLRWYSARHDAFDEPFDGIVYGATASLGFAAAENMVYVLPGGMGVGLSRALTAVPMHASCGVLMGACIGIGTFARRGRLAFLLAGLAGAILLHGTYDAFLFVGRHLRDSGREELGWLCLLGVLATLALGVVASVLGIARMRRDQERALLLHTAAPRPAMVPPPEAPRPTTTAPPPPPPTFRAPPPPPTLAWGAPKLPMAALLCSSFASAALVLLLLIAVLVGEQDAESMPDSAAIVALLALVASGLGAVAGVVLGVVALVQEPRWRPASVASIAVGALLGLLLLAAIVAGVLEAEITSPSSGTT